MLSGNTLKAVSVGFPSMYERILVPVDGGDRADRAASRAIDLASEHGASVYLLSVVDTVEVPEPARSSVELVTNSVEEQAMTDLARAAAKATSAGVDVETRLCHGVPHREIPDVADDLDVDLIVFGARPGSSEKSLVGRIQRATDREVLVAE